jgi:hypothetical protein
LRANQATYAKEGSLSEYYKRLGPRSPAKKVTDTVKTEGEPLVKKVRRKTQAAGDPPAAATYVFIQRASLFTLFGLLTAS